LRIAAFTDNGIQMASSRLRSFYVFQSPVWKDHEVVFNPKFLSLNAFHCIHLQKLLKPRFILLALYARLIGKQVIYDIDDKIKHLIPLLLMVSIAHTVVTDTELRKKYLQGKTRKKNINVIGDALDCNQYDLNRKNLLRIVSLKVESKEKTIILWVGNVDNFNSFKVLIEADERFSQYEIVVVTDISNPSKVKLSHPNYTIKQWSINWASYLNNKNRYFMLLNHNDINDKNSIYKSEVKMTSAIYNFIMPIVSNSHAYSAFAKNLNAEFLVFNKDIDPFDILVKMECRDNEFFDDFFKNSLHYINENYSNEFISKKILNLIKISS
jgi:hypothetical protein